MARREGKGGVRGLDNAKCTRSPVCEKSAITSIKNFGARWMGMQSPGEEFEVICKTCQAKLPDFAAEGFPIPENSRPVIIISIFLQASPGCEIYSKVRKQKKKKDIADPPQERENSEYY